MGILSKSKKQPESTILAGRIQSLESECNDLRTALADYERAAVEATADADAYAAACNQVATTQTALAAKTGILARMNESHRAAAENEKAAYLDKLRTRLATAREDQRKECKAVSEAFAEEDRRHIENKKALTARHGKAMRAMIPIEKEIQLAERGITEEAVQESVRLHESIHSLCEAMRPLEAERSPIATRISSISSFLTTTSLPSQEAKNAMLSERSELEARLSRIDLELAPMKEELDSIRCRIREIEGE